MTENSKYRMEIIKLSYCIKHKEYFVRDCPNCLADDVEAETLKRVREWLETHHNNGYYYEVYPEEVSQLKAGKMPGKE
jgi:hypothetical protein